MLVVASLASTVTHWVETGGILAVFLLMAAESCGVPFPSEVIMPFAGYFAGAGHLSFGGAVVAGAVGNLVGSLVAYAVSARFGEPVLRGPGRYVGIRPHHIEIADRWFQRYGLAAVFFGRLLPVVRTYISFPAGLARVDLVWFSVLTFVGALPWCLGLTVAGYEVGANYDNVSKPVQIAGYVIAVLVVAAVVAWFVRGRRGGGAAGEREATDTG
jgi:membrane protein DedA with SNARE-associated domain